MRLFVTPVTPLQQNCSILACDETSEAAVVDPGGELDRVLARVDHEGLKLTKILITHGHIDHAGATARLARRFDLPIEGPHPADRFWIEQLALQASIFGLEASEPFTPTRWLQHGDTVTLGAQTLEVLHCPGHTPGHVVFFDRRDRLAIVGDVLFHGSIGRSDFPGGNHEQLLRSIRERLLPLGDEVRFLPGHGPMSTFGEERLHNPFLIRAASAGNGPAAAPGTATSDR